MKMEIKTMMENALKNAIHPLHINTACKQKRFHSFINSKLILSTDKIRPKTEVD